MRLPSWYKILEDTREASLELVAAGVESYATLDLGDGCSSSSDGDSGVELNEDAAPRARRSAANARAAAHCRDRGDFLFDWMRLNINYMNQVAMLGSSYAGVAARGLSALYSRSAVSKPRRRCEVEFRGHPGERVTSRVCVRNDLHECAALTIDRLKNGRLRLGFREVGAHNNLFSTDVEVRDDNGDRFESCELDPGERLWLVLDLMLGELEPGRCYVAKLNARLGAHSKPISLVVEALSR